jgi:hypothetical protein
MITLDTIANVVAEAMRKAAVIFTDGSIFADRESDEEEARRETSYGSTPQISSAQWGRKMPKTWEQMTTEENVEDLRRDMKRRRCHVRSFYLSIARTVHRLHVEISAP